MARGRQRVEEACAAAIRQIVSEVHRDKTQSRPLPLDEYRFLWLPKLSFGNDEADPIPQPRYTFKDFKADIEGMRRQRE